MGNSAPKASKNYIWQSVFGENQTLPSNFQQNQSIDNQVSWRIKGFIYWKPLGVASWKPLMSFSMARAGVALGGCLLMWLIAIYPRNYQRRCLLRTSIFQRSFQRVLVNWYIEIDWDILRSWFSSSQLGCKTAKNSKQTCHHQACVESCWFLGIHVFVPSNGDICMGYSGGIGGWSSRVGQASQTPLSRMEHHGRYASNFHTYMESRQPPPLPHMLWNW